MFPVPDGANLPDAAPAIQHHVPSPAPGSPWRCKRCDVGLSSRHKPVCWFCGKADLMVPGHQYHAPTSSAWLNRSHLTAPPPEEP